MTKYIKGEILLGQNILRMRYFYEKYIKDEIQLGQNILKLKYFYHKIY
jgi:hypothetical protein